MAHENLQKIIAENITSLRRSHGMTQAGLAEKLGYSDKSVSKWERADGIPDVLCLKAMADLFGVTVDYMLTSEHPADGAERTVPAEPAEKPPEYAVSRRNITLLSVAGVWLLAFIVAVIVRISGTVFVLPFVAALPISALLLVIFNSVWGRRAWHFYAVSFLVWAILFLLCWLLRPRAWLLMLVGIPATVVVWLSCRVRKKTEPPS